MLNSLYAHLTLTIFRLTNKQQQSLVLIDAIIWKDTKTLDAYALKSFILPKKLLTSNFWTTFYYSYGQRVVT